MIFQRSALTAVLGTALLSAAPPAIAAEESNLATGNGLYTACSSSHSLSEMQCMAFLEGFIHGGTAAWTSIAGVDSEGRANRPLYCPSPGVTIGQLKDVIIKGLRDRPELRHRQTPFLVQDILRRAFPCTEP